MTTQHFINLTNGLQAIEEYGLDIDAAVRAKMEKNKGRGHRHGGKRV